MPIMDAVWQEEAAVADGHAVACAHYCECHGGYTCVRAVHPVEAEDMQPHVGYDDDGQPVTWIGPCPPETDGEKA